MQLTDGDVERGTYRAELPGRPAASAYFYYLVLVDELELAAKYPADGPVSLLGFRILAQP
jgi:hypothetical protein